ncbi:MULTISPECIES: ABC transporter permease [Raoultella]|uniref:ABC transporter permease n=1 Tax=Raoultella TaxID=160674 RepID=UPI0021683DF8|nr:MULTISPECIES: ABC transporter permease [Raoultella]MCS4271246.1 peptide/nickel transport system permease protein [Raoultella sp. BIGb0132]MCS4288445.1 peptide/nickel transport system permease protein [Raoultella terrigena]
MKRKNIVLAPNALLGIALIGTIALAGIIGFFWTPLDPSRINILARLQAPGAGHLLGTDEYGRDVLSRLLAGANASMTISLVTVGFALLVGITLGLISGYLRGAVDRLIMMVTDALLAFPGILLALALLSILGNNRYGIILSLGLAYTPSVVRIVRGTVLGLREAEFVSAARVMGHNEWAILRRHILPNCLAPLTVLATSMLGWVLISESALSFLGLGVPPPEPTWGNMLAASRSYLAQAPWLALLPGLCISLALLGVNMLGDALRDYLDPRMQ